jgi:ribonuclease E
MTTPCSYCNGKAYTKSAATIAYEILRQIRRDASVIGGDSVVVHANPEVADLMRGPELPAVDETVKRIHRGIEIHARKGFHIEQFEIKGKVPGQAQQKPGRGRRRRGGRDDDDSLPGGEGHAEGGQLDEAIDEA